MLDLMTKLSHRERNIIFALAGSVVLTACGGGSDATPAPSAEKTEVAKIRQQAASLNAGAPLISDELRQRMNSLAADARPAAIASAVRKANAQQDRRVEQYFIHYGEVDDAVISAARQYPLVILHPLTGKLTRQKVAAIQQGVDANDSSDDVKVLLYISVGEDLRTAGLSDEQMAADARFVGEGIGPRVDPRGVYPNGNPEMDNIPVLGKPSPAGTGFASYYLDDNSVVNDPNALGDGKPDRNGIFGGAFVNIGDPNWFETLQRMQLDGVDRLAGFREILMQDYGRGLAADGVFLDTIDTAAPNHFTDGNSSNQSEFEWTAPGVKRFIERLRAAYPDSLILQNRGLFFFDPRHAHYQHNARSSINYLLFESYRLNSNTTEEFSPFFFADNKHTIAPKLMAAASGEDGFQVLSLGYAEGPALSADDLFSATGAALQTLTTDITEAHKAGFSHYIGNAAIDVANHFVREHSSGEDSEAPVWNSIYNANQPGFPTPASAAEARVGIQALTAEKGGLRLHWDVALDQNAVTYRAYWQAQAFDFAAATPLADADSKVLTTHAGVGLGQGNLARRYAFQDRIEGLSSEHEYHVVIRAEDSKGNAESNTQAISASPLPVFAVDGEFGEWNSVAALHNDSADVSLSAGADFLQIKMVQEQQQLYLYFDSNTRFSLDGSPDYSYSRNLIFIDADNNAATGYPIAGVIGSDYVINGQHLYLQSATQFNAGFVSTLDVALNENNTALELLLPLGLLGDKADQLRLVFLNDELGDYAPDFGGAIAFNLQNAEAPQDAITVDGDLSEWLTRPGLADGNDSPQSAGPDWQSLWLANDDEHVYLAWRSEHAYNLDGSPAYPYSRNLILLDTDENAESGYQFNGIGSDYLIAGDSLYKQEAGVFNAGIVQALTVEPKTTARDFEMRLPGALLGDNRWLQLSAVNDESFDLIPNSGRVYRYDRLNGRGVEIASTQAIRPVRIDGDYSDWTQIPVYLRDSSGDAAATVNGPDWREIKLAHDADNLYVLAGTANAFNLSGEPDYAYSRTLIFIDSDNNPDTGYAVNGIGSDLVINGDAVYSQSSDQFALAFLGRVPLAGREMTQRFELSLPREWLGDDPARIKLQLLNDEVFDYAPEQGATFMYRLR
jgi:hypothetical protein